MERSIEIQHVYDHPRHRVWRMLTDSQALSVWLADNDFRPRVGHRFQVSIAPARGREPPAQCRVLEIDAPRRMLWSWRRDRLNTRIVFEVEPAGDGTRLRVTQTGFRGLRAVLTSFAVGRGSRTNYEHRLPAVLDQLAESGGFSTAETDRRARAPFLSRLFHPRS